MSFPAARKEATRQLKAMSFSHLEKHAKPLDKTKTKYSWRDLVVWNTKQSTWYKTKAESPTVLSFGMIFLFMLIVSLFPASPESASVLFTMFLLVMFLIPIGAEWMERVALANLISGLKVAHIKIQHVGLNKTFEIRDVVINWRKLPYDPKKRGVKSSTARSRGAIELQFKNPWQIGTPENPHIFNTIVIWGKSTFLQSLDSLAPYHIQETDIFGVPLKTGVYEFSLKVDEKSWDPSINQFVAISWATRETAGDYKRYEAFLVMSPEEAIKECPHCGLSLEDDELEATNRYRAKELKEQMMQSAVKAAHEEQLKDQTLRSDFKYDSVQRFLGRYYSKSRLDLSKLKKLKWWQWVIIGIGIFVLLYLGSPSFRLFINTLPDRLGGAPSNGNGGAPPNGNGGEPPV